MKTKPVTLKKKKTIGELIDKMYAIDQQIKTIAAQQVKPLGDRRRKLEARIMERMYKQGTSSVRAKTALASIKKTRHISVSDRRKLDKYVARNKAFDLFTNAVNKKAFFDRADEGILVPGIDIFERKSLSLTKSGKK